MILEKGKYESRYGIGGSIASIFVIDDSLLRVAL